MIELRNTRFIQSPICAGNSRQNSGGRRTLMGLYSLTTVSLTVGNNTPSQLGSFFLSIVEPLTTVYQNPKIYVYVYMYICIYIFVKCKMCIYFVIFIYILDAWIHNQQG